MRNGRGFMMSAALVGAVSVGVLTFVACSEDSPTRPRTGGRGAACNGEPGEFPAADCDNSANECNSAGCSINESKCGSKSTCLPLADNAGKQVLDFRIRRLNVAGPPPLAEAFIQKSVVTQNIDLDARECGENGKGAFNWLVRIDRTKNEFVTGGAPPSDDPFNTGYCFFNDETAGIPISPARAAFTESNGKITTEPLARLNVPIFLDGDIDNVIILPLSNVIIRDLSVSDNNNCIGAFNNSALTASCQEDPETCTKWKTSASLGGYITLEEADQVRVDVLNQSLCVLLTRTPKDPSTNKCQRRDGKIVGEGNYCSTSKKPGDCKDSFWLSATFAASAVKIDDNSTVPQCRGTGGGGTDAGTDSGAGDAGTDASTTDSGSDAATTTDAGGDADAG